MRYDYILHVQVTLYIFFQFKEYTGHFKLLELKINYKTYRKAKNMYISPSRI